MLYGGLMNKIVKVKMFAVVTVAMVIIYVGLGFYSVGNANQLNDLYENSYKNSISVGSHTINLYGNFLSVQSFLNEAAGSMTEEQIRYALNQVNDEGLKIQNNFSEIRSVSADKFDQNSGLLTIILEEFQAYEVAKDETYMLLNEGELLKCKNTIDLVLIPQIKAISINLKIFVERENNNVREAYVEYRNVSEYIRFQVWLGIIVLFVFSIYATVYMLNNRKELREKEFIGKEEFRITIDTIVEGVIVMDQDLKIIKINQFAEAMTGWKSDDANGKPLEEVFKVFDEKTKASQINRIKKKLLSGDNKLDELSGILIAASKDQRVVALNNSTINNIYGGTTGHVLTFRDITERRKKEKAIYYMTYHDQVTHLHNRTYFEEQKTIIDVKDNYPISVVQGDINGLKLINDAFGHAKGDDLLRDAAKILKKYCRANDVIARTGGDEFTILMPNTTNIEANKVIGNIEKEIITMESITDGRAFFISIALGAATANKYVDSLDEVIKGADETMYKKKLLEKNSLHSSLLKSIKTTLEEKSHETEAHASRLVDLSRRLGEVLKLSKRELYELELLSNLHDIGKIGISNQILNKKGPLTNEEWVEMKKHPEIGYRIAQSTPELGGIAQYILCHHERWDGKGYPQGLEGENIPRLSRLISIVDAFDAMTDDRVYRKGIAKEDALDEIEKNAGTQFDPYIASKFVEIIK